MKLVFFSALVFFSSLAYGDPTNDPYQSVYNSVDVNLIWKNLRQMTGYDPITSEGRTFSIPERETEIGKANFRVYFKDYFNSLGMSVRDLPYKSSWDTGVNLEAVLPGKSQDSVIIISHYDSTGKPGNPAVDDAASGIAIMFEAARQFTQLQKNLDRTVRFVVADHEEDTNSGNMYYAKYITDLARSEKFKLFATVDYDQSGWMSPHNKGSTIDVYTNGGSDAHRWLADLLGNVVSTYSDLQTQVLDMPGGLDFSVLDSLYNIPGICPSEMDGYSNPYKDREDDTLEKIDQAYYFKIAKVGVTFAAKVIGLNP